MPTTLRTFVWSLRVAIGYCVLSCLTLPFIARLWWGELPVLAFVQMPKIALAGWLRTHVVMEAVTALGLSRGSFSPDYILARPFALAIVYLIPMVIVGLIGLRRRPFNDRCSAITITFLAGATLDYVFTLVFADQRLLTIY